MWLNPVYFLKYFLLYFLLRVKWIVIFEIWILFQTIFRNQRYQEWFQKRYSKSICKIIRKEHSNANSKSFLPYCSLFSSFRDTFGRAILGSLRVQSNPKQTGFGVERGRQNLPNDDKLGYISHCKNDLNVLINTLCT